MRGGGTPPPLNFLGAGGRGRCPWLCQCARSSGTGADGPQAEERAMAADAHRIAWVPGDEFLFFVFLAEALKKSRSVRLWKKGPAKFQNVCFYSNSLILGADNLESVLSCVLCPWKVNFEGRRTRAGRAQRTLDNFGSKMGVPLAPPHKKVTFVTRNN